MKAYIVLKNGVRCTEEELNEFSRKYLAAIKFRAFINFEISFPKQWCGKYFGRALIDEENEKA